MTSVSNHYFSEQNCHLDEFRACCAKRLTNTDCPLAYTIEQNIPVYDMDQLPITPNLMGEWVGNLRDGSGIVLLKNAVQHHAAIDQATEAFNAILKQEAAMEAGAGDHFAKAGENGRIWNSLQKLCEYSPDTFARYYASPAIDAICRAWLGPAYQMTAQVNLVRPGSAAQLAHRDYHLGFMSTEQAAEYPVHAHELSSTMTLQGAIAHVEIPVAAGPTKLLPFSQTYKAGYLAWRRDDFREFFEKNHVQLPLSKGDALFFSPAVFHAGGANTTQHVQRLVNLLQVSSAMGRSMETVDRAALCKWLYPVIQTLPLEAAALDALIAASAEGYSFPTNLDRDLPANGLAPETQAQLLRRALNEHLAFDEFNHAIDEQMAKKSM